MENRNNKKATLFLSFFYCQEGRVFFVAFRDSSVYLNYFLFYTSVLRAELRPSSTELFWIFAKIEQTPFYFRFYFRKLCFTTDVTFIIYGRILGNRTRRVIDFLALTLVTSSLLDDSYFLCLLIVGILLSHKRRLRAEFWVSKNIEVRELKGINFTA